MIITPIIATIVIIYYIFHGVIALSAEADKKERELFKKYAKKKE